MRVSIDTYPFVTAILRHSPRWLADLVVATIHDQRLDVAVEITIDSENFSDVSRYTQEYPGVHVGAGTVTTVSSAKKAAEAGCEFILAPVVLDANIIDACHDAGLLAISGAYSPTEVFEAHSRGADIVKVFPARDLSPRYVADIRAPLGQIPLMGVGGVSVDESPQWRERGYDYVGIGTGMFPRPAKELTPREVVEALRLAGA